MSMNVFNSMVGSTPLRVVMITGRADFGGGPEHVFRLSKEICGRVEVFIASPRDEPYWERFAGIVGSSRMLAIPHRKLSLSALVALRRFVRLHRIDVLHAHGRTAGLYGRMAALLTRKPCFYTPHGGTPLESVKTFGLACVEFLLSLWTDRVIAVSSSEAEGLQQLCAWHRQLKVILNGVEIPDQPVISDVAANQPVQVIHATRFVYPKNTELLLPVLRSLREQGELARFRFIILGDGPGRSAFEAALRAEDLHAHVEFKGAVTNPQSYLRQCFCLLSTSRWEGLPLVVLEAMAVGLPVIATNVVGNRDAVDDGQTGFLYPLESPGTAVEHLIRLRGDRPLWTTLSQASRERAKTLFSVETMADKTLALYRELLVSHTVRKEHPPRSLERAVIK